MTAALLERASSTDRAVAGGAVLFCAIVTWATIPSNEVVADAENPGSWQGTGRSQEDAGPSANRRPQLMHPANYSARPLLAPGRRPDRSSASPPVDQTDSRKQVPRLSGIVVISNIPYALLSGADEEDSQIFATGDAIGDWMVYELGATSVQLRDLTTDRRLILHLAGKKNGSGEGVVDGNSHIQAPSR